MSFTLRPTRQRSRIASTGLLVTLMLAVFAIVLPAGSANAATTTCTQPDGFQFRTDWTRANGLTDVTDLKMRSSSSDPWASYTDFWGRVSKLEWWTPDSFTSLFTHAGDWNHPAATLYFDLPSYAHWYGAADQRADVLATKVFEFLSPRVSNRDNGSPLVRNADLCDNFLSDWRTGTGPRVAIAGDSITVQMTKRFNALTDWRPFIEPQSGQAFSSMQGELRGMAAGIRDPNTGAQTRPDALVLALGTNDAGSIAGRPTQAERDNALIGFGWNLARVLIDTDAVQCRVLVTTHESGWRRVNGGAPEYLPILKQARKDVNAKIRDAAAADPDIELVDWAQMSSTHGWYNPASGVPWYPDGDPTHPNPAGLEKLSDALHDAAVGCG